MPHHDSLPLAVAEFVVSTLGPLAASACIRAAVGEPLCLYSLSSRIACCSTNCLRRIAVGVRNSVAIRSVSLYRQLPSTHRRRRPRIQLNRSCCPPRSLSAAHRRWRRGVGPSSGTLSASALPLLCPIAARSPYAAIGRQRPITGLPYGATIRLLPAKALVQEVDLAHIFPGFSKALM